ncbi:MAG: tRNA pseudouridine(38-40) synthase TruA [Candidatus Omnitrophota bacterium]|jgi:tRNA pseudouridine38-40 synthase
MRKIKLTLEYDGTGFSGFQRQNGRPTIQAALEKALSKLFDRRMKIGAASSRTDAGVHAAGQVVHFVTDSRLELFHIEGGLNRYLPAEIAVVKAEEAPADFHARFHARSKIYQYSVWHHPSRSPLRARESHHVYGKLDLARMRRAARVFKGRHDFRSFCASSGRDEEAVENGTVKGRGTVRTVKRFELKKQGSLILFVIEADGFLYHMVRNIVGTMLELGRGKLTVKALKAILAAKDRRRAGGTAPACGLKLARVFY